MIAQASRSERQTVEPRATVNGLDRGSMLPGGVRANRRRMLATTPDYDSDAVAAPPLR
jgi:hypothetical protein